MNKHDTLSWLQELCPNSSAQATRLVRIKVRIRQRGTTDNSRCSSMAQSTALSTPFRDLAAVMKHPPHQNLKMAKGWLFANVSAGTFVQGVNSASARPARIPGVAANDPQQHVNESSLFRQGEQ